MVNQKEDAEDITTNVFVSLWDRRENVEAKKAKAFLLVTANRKCLDHIKVNKRYNKRLESFSLAELDEIEIDTEVLSHLHKLINELPPQQKKMILLKYGKGEGARNIAKLLNLKQQTVSNTLHSAIQLLRRQIKDHLRKI
jgi:RNA polymerase sigma-70 factor (ECF subfamily)